MPKKIREIKKLLTQAGFYMREGKGSHSNWKHPQLETIVTIARRDGEAAHKGQEALESIVEFYQAEGWSLPQPKTLQNV